MPPTPGAVWAGAAWTRAAGHALEPLKQCSNTVGARTTRDGCGGCGWGQAGRGCGQLGRCGAVFGGGVGDVGMHRSP